MSEWIDPGDFNEPVLITREDAVFEVHNARDAVSILLYEWPSNSQTFNRMQARMACMKALGGSTDPLEARQAFIQAAREVAILAPA